MLRRTLRQTILLAAGICLCGSACAAVSTVPAPPSSATSLQTLTEQATTGDAKAEVALGSRLLARKDPDAQARGIEWLRKAAVQGNTDAQWQLGSAYLSGTGVASDTTQALKWWRKSLRDGSADHMALFGYVKLHHGLELGDDQVTQQGARWLRRGAQAGSVHGMELFALALFTGKMGLRQDKHAAEQWMLKAARLGDTNAEAVLGKMYVTGILGHGKTQAGLRWLRTAADAGEVDAEGTLAVLLVGGEYHVPKRPTEGVRLAEKAAAKGSALGYYALGLAYQSGEGKPVDPAQAWYHFAVAQRLDTKHALKHVQQHMTAAAAKLSRTQLDQLRRHADKVSAPPRPSS